MPDLEEGRNESGMWKKVYIYVSGINKRVVLWQGQVGKSKTNLMGLL